METEGSLACSQEPAFGSCPEQKKPVHSPSYFFEIHVSNTLVCDCIFQEFIFHRFAHQIRYNFYFFSLRALCFAFLILLNLTIVPVMARSRSHATVITQVSSSSRYFHLGLNIFLLTLISPTPSCSSFHLRYQLLHPFC